MKKNLEAYGDTDLKPADLTKIARDLGVTEAEVVSMNRRMLMGGDASLNVPLREEGEGQWQDILPDDTPLQDDLLASDQEARIRGQLLREAMKGLNERERHIFVERRLIEEPKTLEQLSDVYHVSRERIRQIEVRAFEKVEKAIRRLAQERRLTA
jgi:RNA polymerase sigma-32 factor